MVNRESRSRSFDVTLRNQRGTTKLYSKEEMTGQGLLGAHIEALSTDQKRELGLRYGVVVTDPGNGKLKRAGVPKDFIIIKVNNELISTPDEMEKLLKNLGQGDGVLIQGYHPNGKPDYFAFGL
jgi:S1-C subfamily serine protease